MGSDIRPAGLPVTRSDLDNAAFSTDSVAHRRES